MLVSIVLWLLLLLVLTNVCVFRVCESLLENNVSSQIVFTKRVFNTTDYTWSPYALATYGKFCTIKLRIAPCDTILVANFVCFLLCYQNSPHPLLDLFRLIFMREYKQVQFLKFSSPPTVGWMTKKANERENGLFEL